MPTLIRSAAVLFPLLGWLQAFADTDADFGAKIAAQGTTKGVAPCITCHGPDGAGMAPAGYPRIAGLDAAYLAKQLNAYRAGKRNNPVMMPMAKNLTEDEVLAVSAHYAAMPIPAVAAQPPADTVARTAKDLIEWGDWTGRGLPACSQCHAPDGNGIGSRFPGISGQHASYLKAQLQAWRATGSQVKLRKARTSSLRNVAGSCNRLDYADRSTLKDASTRDVDKQRHANQTSRPIWTSQGPVCTLAVKR